MSDARGKTYRPWDPEHYRHKAHSPEAKLPEDDLVFFLNTVPHLALSRFSRVLQPFGTLEAVELVLSACGWQINTALSNASTCRCASTGWPRGGESPHCARARTAYASSSPCIMRMITLCCLMPAYDSLCPGRGRPPAGVPPRCGGPIRQRWPPV